MDDKASQSERSDREFIVTIDGPAGAGKSSVSRQLAKRFAFAFLDTGAMYRVVTLAGIRLCADLSDTIAMVELAERLQIEFKSDQILVDGDDVTTAIRAHEVSTQIHHVADNPAIRSLLGTLQRRIAHGKQIVTEGRDQGTEVFPQAQCKIFLTAKPETRARRRLLELLDRGMAIEYEEVLAAQDKRDAEDAARPVGALRPAHDATIVYTDGMDQEEVVDRLAAIVRERLS